MDRPSKKLVLENGMEFHGICFGANRNCVAEIVFNTSVVGYQEIMTDPSYAGQIVVMTYPLIGNYGITDEDYESRDCFVAGLVVRECCDTPSNFRCTKTLEETLLDQSIPCVSGIDTRLLTKIIRSLGRPMAAIVDENMSTEDALALIKDSTSKVNLVEKVSCRKRWLTRTPSHNYDVVVIDFGVKNSLIRLLGSKGCNVTILPYNTSAQTALSYNPDGILLSNGPGLTENVPSLGEFLDEVIGKVPVFGVGLGMEAIGIHYGAKPVSMGCGVHGDHPVKDLSTGRTAIAVMNQSVRFDSVEGTALTPTHISVPEAYVEGFCNSAEMVSGVQFNFDAAPGPQDFREIIDGFIKMMEEKRNA